MKRVHFVLAIFLAMMVFSSAVPAAASGDGNKRTSGAAGKIRQTEGRKTIMIIPLDSRPANTQYPELIARSAGFNVMMPPARLLGDLKTDGDCEKIIAWADDNASGADAFIVSISMVSYGGLVGSRRPVQTRERALENIRLLERLKAKRPGRPVFAYDAIQRLAITAGNEEELKYYNLIRSWAILKDEVENCGCEAKRAEYDGVQKQIPAETLQKYLATRARNHEVNLKVIEYVKSGIIDYLIMGQDDASKFGIHRAEREDLLDNVKRLGLVNRVRIFAGLDEIDAVLVSRLAALLYGVRPKACVEYFTSANGEKFVAEYEDIPLCDNVARHVIAAGGMLVASPEEADVTILVSFNRETGEVMANNIKRLVARASELIQNNRAVAVADLGNQKSELRLVDLLTRVTDITRLSSYCAWNTAGNAVGLLIGHSFARACIFKSELDPRTKKGVFVDAALANYEFLLYRFLKDYSYKAKVNPMAKEFAKSIGADQLSLGDNLVRMSSFVSEKMAPEFEFWASQFIGRKVSVTRPGALDAEIFRLGDFFVRLPWARLFEAEFHFRMEMKVFEN